MRAYSTLQVRTANRVQVIVCTLMLTCGALRLIPLDVLEMSMLIQDADRNREMCTVSFPSLLSLGGTGG